MNNQEESIVLNADQKERIRTNRERALQLRQRSLKRGNLEMVERGYFEEAQACKSLKCDSLDNKDACAEKTKHMCEHCGETNHVLFSADYLDAFGISVCVKCKNTNDNYKLLSKSEVRNEFCLPDGSISLLRYIEKENPRNKAFSCMKLFLKKQVQEKAWGKFGGEGGLQKEKEKRDRTKWEGALKKTKNIFHVVQSYNDPEV